MNTVTATNRQTRWMAGSVALLATLLTLGGSMLLAEHYARTGASPEASGYYAAERSARGAENS